MKTLIFILGSFAILVSGCAKHSVSQGKYDDLFSNKGEWVEINSQQIKESLTNE